MTDREPEQWSPEGLVDYFGDVDRKMHDRRFCFILGAGASVQSGIPAAGALVRRWLGELHQRLRRDPRPLEAWATADALKIPGFSFAQAAAFYSQVFARRFGRQPEEGYADLEDIMQGKDPSFGYSVLAHILAETRHKLVITTNFDNLVADALSIFTGTSPLVCGHESLAPFIRVVPRRPVVVKIHRDLLMAPMNQVDEIAALQAAWIDPLTHVFKAYTPIVVGYGGNDGSLMGFLKGLPPRAIPGGIFWCYWGPGGPPGPEIRDLVAHHDGVLVPIDGFDELMLLLSAKLRMPLLDGVLEQKSRARVDSYRRRVEELRARLFPPPPPPEDGPTPEPVPQDSPAVAAPAQPPVPQDRPTEPALSDSHNTARARAPVPPDSLEAVRPATGPAGQAASPDPRETPRRTVHGSDAPEAATARPGEPAATAASPAGERRPTRSADITRSAGPTPPPPARAPEPTHSAAPRRTLGHESEGAPRGAGSEAAHPGPVLPTLSLRPSASPPAPRAGATPGAAVPVLSTLSHPPSATPSSPHAAPHAPEDSSTDDELPAALDPAAGDGLDDELPAAFTTIGSDSVAEEALSGPTARRLEPQEQSPLQRALREVATATHDDSAFTALMQARAEPDYARSFDLFRAALRRFPGDPELLAGFAERLSEVPDPSSVREAISVLETLVDLVPDDQRALRHLALLRAWRGDFKAATAELRRAWKLASAGPDTPSLALAAFIAGLFARRGSRSDTRFLAVLKAAVREHPPQAVLPRNLVVGLLKNLDNPSRRLYGTLDKVLAEGLPLARAEALEPRFAEIAAADLTALGPDDLP